MANIKYSEQEWERAREYFEAGLSLSEIMDKTGIEKTRISKRSKHDNWIKSNTEKQQLIIDAVRVTEAKATLNATALSVHEELVDERIKHIMFFNNAAIRNVQEAMSTKCENQNDFKARAETINKGREVVLGKTPDVALQINNTANQSTEELGHSTGFLKTLVEEINASK